MRAWTAHITFGMNAVIVEGIERWLRVGADRRSATIGSTSSPLRTASGPGRRTVKSLALSRAEVSIALASPHFPEAESPSMSLKCGIVGLPNVGKSTLFNALTKAGIAAENYPFCTIEPNVGIVELPDPRLAAAGGDRQARARRAGDRRVRRHRRPGGRRLKGEGLGNQFLAHIRETDAIVNVVRCFDDENVIHVAGKVDPISDIEVIQTELCLADLATVEKSLHALHQGRQGRQRQGSAAPGRRARQVPGGAGPGASRCARIAFSKEELAVLKPLCLITAKPAMFVGNVDEHGFENNPLLDQLRAYADGAEGAGGGDLRQDRGRAGRHGRRGPA